MTSRGCCIFLVILAVLVLGCLNKPDLPGQSSCSLTIRLQFQGSIENKDIQSIKGSLSMNDGDLEQERTAAFTADNPGLTFEKVYPGNWGVTISALDSVNDTIFQGTSDVDVRSGSVNNATITLIPASASLNVSFDASPIPGIGSTYTKGRFGVYFNPTSNRGTYYDLILEKNQLCTLIKKIPEGTFDARICVPNATSPVYATPRFKIQLSAGKQSIIHVEADGKVDINPRSDLRPPTPSGINLTRQENTVTLNWLPVVTYQIAGYRVYRTDPKGFFTLISTLTGQQNQFTESVSSSLAHKKKILYSISSYDSNGFESLWSESREVTF